MKKSLITVPSADIFLYMKFPLLIGKDCGIRLTEEHVSWPIILLIVKFGDSFNASIAQQQFILMRIIGKMILAVLHTHLSQKRISIFFTLFLFPSLSNPFFPLSLVWTLLDVWLDQPQQRVVPAESHRDWGELPTRAGPADAAQPLCHEFHGELGAAQEGERASTRALGTWEML